MDLEATLMETDIDGTLSQDSVIGKRLTARIEAAERRRAVETLELAKERVAWAMERCISAVESGGSAGGDEQERESGVETERLKKGDAVDQTVPAEQELTKQFAEFERLTKSLASAEGT